MKALKALRDVVEMASVTEGPWEREESKLAVRQLRALLAVARAAERGLKRGYGYNVVESLVRALRRLRRASAAAGRGERDG